VPDTTNEAPARMLDHSPESKDNPWLLEVEQRVGQLSEPDQLDITQPNPDAFEGVTLTEEQEEAIEEYENAHGNIETVYDEANDAHVSLVDAYQTLVEAFGFQPRH